VVEFFDNNAAFASPCCLGAEDEEEEDCLLAVDLGVAVCAPPPPPPPGLFVDVACSPEEVALASLSRLRSRVSVLLVLLLLFVSFETRDWLHVDAEPALLINDEAAEFDEEEETRMTERGRLLLLGILRSFPSLAFLRFSLFFLLLFFPFPLIFFLPIALVEDNAEDPISPSSELVVPVFVDWSPGDCVLVTDEKTPAVPDELTAATAGDDDELT